MRLSTSGPVYVCPSHPWVTRTSAGTEEASATTASTTQYAGRIRAARRRAYRPVEGHRAPVTRARAYGRYSRKPDSTKKTATPASKRASTAPPAPRPTSPVWNATWVSSTASAATARSPSSIGSVSPRASVPTALTVPP